MWNEQSSDIESGKTSRLAFRSAVESSVMKSSGPFFPRPPKHSPSNKDRYTCKAHEIVSFCSFDSNRTMSSPPAAEWVSNKKMCFLYPYVLLHQRKPFHCYAWSYHFINGVQMAMMISLLSVIAIKFSSVLSWQLSEATMDVQSNSMFNVFTCCFIAGNWTSTGLDWLCGKAGSIAE